MSNSNCPRCNNEEEFCPICGGWAANGGFFEEPHCGFDKYDFDVDAHWGESEQDYD